MRADEYRNAGRKILLMLMLLYLSLKFSCMDATASEAAGFLPGGAWELDLGREIETEDFECFTYDEYNKAAKDEADDALSAEGQGIEGYSFDHMYDPRITGLVSEVKDQGRTALCWDFAANSTAESVLIKTGEYDSSLDLSEYQTAALAYQSLKEDGMISEGMTFYEFCNDGGKPSYVWQQWMKGYGPVKEDRYPAVTTVSDNSVIPQEMKLEHIRNLTSVMTIMDNVDAVKAAITEKGAVFALYYSYPLYYNDFVNEQGDSSYYMPYSTGSRNHAISIVGWDDDFPAGAFAKDFDRENRDGEVIDEPLPSGAWLIKNSWGKRAYKTPDEASGYYWISYYDKSLSNFTAVSFDEDEIDCTEDETEEDSEDSELEDESDTDDSDEDDINVVDFDPEDDMDDPETDGIDGPDEEGFEVNRNHGQRKDALGRSDGGEDNLSTADVKDGSVKKGKKQKAKNITIKGIVYTINGGKAKVKSVKSRKRRVRIPAKIKYKGKKYPVTKIGRRTFVGNKYVRTIILGRNIRSIGKEAFMGCRNLKSIRIERGQGK